MGQRIGSSPSPDPELIKALTIQQPYRALNTPGSTNIIEIDGKIRDVDEFASSFGSNSNC